MDPFGSSIMIQIGINILCLVEIGGHINLFAPVFFNAGRNEQDDQHGYEQCLEKRIEGNIG